MIHRPPTAFDLRGVDFNQVARQAMQPWADAWNSWQTGMDSWQRTSTGTLLRPTQQSCCPSCGSANCQADPCGCRCCVTDADLVLEARVGERRIIPVLIQNCFRRERDVELELSDFSKVSDDVQVRADILGATAFKLAPCGEERVVLGVAVGAAAATPAPNQPPQQTPRATAAAANRAAAAEGATTPGRERELPDVDACRVAYADLRVKGCDMRSIRIAVAVLPRTCDPFTVDCGCACCC